MSLKILVISFLFLIGSNLCAEAFHQEMNKAFIYWPALFALGLMLLTIRAEKNRQKASEPIHEHTPVRREKVTS